MVVLSGSGKYSRFFKILGHWRQFQPSTGERKINCRRQTAGLGVMKQGDLVKVLWRRWVVDTEIFVLMYAVWTSLAGAIYLFHIMLENWHTFSCKSYFYNTSKAGWHATVSTSNR